MRTNKKGISVNDLDGLDYNQVNELLSKKGNYIQFLENPNLEQCKIALKQNGYAIRYINDQKPELVDIAINTSPLSIQFVKNPSKEQVDKALKKDAHAIQFIKNPTYEQILYAVSKKGSTISCIDNPSDELIKIALRNQPMALGGICKKMSNAQLKYWIKKFANEKPKALKTVINSVSYDLQKYILSVSGYTLRHINKQTEELCLIAVLNNPTAIQFVEDQTPVIQKAVINSGNALAINYLRISEDYILDLLINKKPKLIHSLENASSELIREYDVSVISKDKKARKNYINSGQRPSDELIETERYKSVVNDLLLNRNFVIEVIDNGFPVYKIINILCSLIEPIESNIATGYLFESGLGMLNPSFKILHKRGVKTKLTIGALQYYRNVVQNNEYVRDMDKNTAKLINKFIKSNLVSLSTYEDAFYHGKYFNIKGENISFTIIGSSNVSSSGLNKNRELNTLYIYHNSNDIIQSADKWYNDFILSCVSLELLDESYFLQHSLKKGIYEITKKDVQTRISTLSDVDQQARLNMWISKNPSKIMKLESDYSLSFSDYIVILYKQYNLCVLESFKGGNAFYCFNSSNYSDIEKDIKNKTKVQLYNHPLLLKRGYHMSDSFNMMLNVNELFSQ